MVSVAEIGALAVIFPGVVDDDAGRGQFDARLRAVRPVETATVDAERDADAALLLRRGEFGATLLGLLVLRTEHVEQLAEHQHVRLLAGRGGRGLVVEVLVTELERVLAHLLRQHVHGDLGRQERLRRTVGTEGRSPGVVGGDRAAAAADVLEVVARADELRLTDRQQIAELRIRTVIDPPVGFHRDQLAVLVAGQLDVDVAGRALAGVGDVLVLVVDQRHRFARSRWPPRRAALPWSARTCSRTCRRSDSGSACSFSGAMPMPGQIMA